MKKAAEERSTEIGISQGQNNKIANNKHFFIFSVFFFFFDKRNKKIGQNLLIFTKVIMHQKLKFDTYKNKFNQKFT